MSGSLKRSIVLPNATGIVGNSDGYVVANDVSLRVSQRGVSSGYITLIKGSIENDSTWTTIATLTGDVLSSLIDVSAYDKIQFTVTVAGSSGTLYISTFFSRASSPAGAGSGAFETIQTDAGTSPVADSWADTLTLTSSDGSITITGNSSTDTINMVANLSSSSGVVPISHGGTGTTTESDARANLGVSITSLYSGGVVTNNGTTFSVTAGVGYIVTQTLLQDEPTHIEVDFSASLNVTPLYTVGIVYVNSSGVIGQADGANPITAEFKRENIVLAAYNVVFGTIVGLFDVSSTPISTAGKLEDLMDAIGPLNISGNVYSANGANLILNKSVGKTFQIKSNIANSLDVRDITTDVVATPLVNTSTFYGYRNGSGGFAYTTYTGVTPTLWDDGTGTPATVSNNKFTIQRVYFFNTTATTIIYLGQTEYNSLVNASAGITTEARIIDNLTIGATFRSSISLKKGTTSLQSATEVAFFESSKFNATGTASSSSVTTLQTAYTNSTTPEITTNTTLGAVSIRRGTAADTDNIIEGLNGAGTITFSVDGNGLITGSNLSGTNTGDQHFTTTTLDFGTEDDYVTATVSATWVTASSVISLTIVPNLTDHDYEDVLIEELTCTVGTIVAGVSFDVHIHAPNGTWGRYIINGMGV